MMLEKITQVRIAIGNFELQTSKDLEAFKSAFTGKNGAIPHLFEALKELPGGADKASIGQALNSLKQEAQARYQAAETELAQKVKPVDVPLDLTLPGAPTAIGSRHPLRLVEQLIVNIFERIGFSVAEGPEIEDDWHNFTALNFPLGHPAREMQDTFFIKPRTDEEGRLLRTHTSSVQIRVMEQQQPPLRYLAPGRVYRNEAISARAHCFFHQVEGFAVDEGLSFADLKQTLRYLVSNLFGPEVAIRLRPSYFPFTELSAEMDIACQICFGAGCAICKHTGWVEILGCGMIDPAVFINTGIDPERYSGYAFGMGIERIAQLRYRVPDLRLYAENDLRFLAQFQGL